MDKKVRQVYDKYMNRYYTKHAVCPKCGSDLSGETLMAYIFNPDKPDDYVDENEIRFGE